MSDIPERRKRKRGRPKGSKNKDRERSVAPDHRCPKCGSTNRDPYSGKRIIEFKTVDPWGEPATHLIKRRTRCSDCGQHRIDTTFAFSPNREPE